MPSLKALTRSAERREQPTEGMRLSLPARPIMEIPRITLGFLTTTAATKAELGPYWHSQGCPVEGYAFPNREDKHAPTRNWSRTFKAAAKRAGITKTVTAYLCRHTFATSCVVSGIPIPVAKEMLGHTALSKTLVEVYSNPDLDMMQKAVAGLTKLGG